MYGVGGADTMKASGDMTTSTDDKSGIVFFHSFNLPEGETIVGQKPEVVLRSEANTIFGFGVEGKTVIDVGAWDGYQSFQAEQRGASRVLATDHFCWGGEGWGNKDGFNYVKRKLNSKIEELEIDVPDITQDKVGEFDVVLFLGVLYHVKEPLTCLERMAAITKEVLIVETETDFNFLPWPMMRYLQHQELNSDPSNFWLPNIRCIEAILTEHGFTRFSISLTPLRLSLGKMDPRRRRVIVHAWKAKNG